MGNIKQCIECKRDIILKLYNTLDKKAVSEKRSVPFCSEICWDKFNEDVIKQHGSPEDLEHYHAIVIERTKELEETVKKILSELE